MYKNGSALSVCTIMCLIRRCLVYSKIHCKSPTFNPIFPKLKLYFRKFFDELNFKKFQSLKKATFNSYFLTNNKDFK